MKRILLLILAAVLALALFGCKKAPEETPQVNQPGENQGQTSLPEEEEEPEDVVRLPAGVSLLGQDLGELSANKAWKKLEDMLANYKLTYQVGTETFGFHAEDFQMTLSQDVFNAWFEATVAGEAADTTGLLTYDISDTVVMLQDYFSSSPKNASIRYDQKEKQFVAVPERNGVHADVSAVPENLEAAVSAMQTSAHVKVTTTPTAPSIKADGPKIQAALAEANSWLTLSLSYVFEAPGVTKGTETLTAEQLASFVDVSSLPIKPNRRAILDYISEVSPRYGGTPTKGNFVTTYGYTLNQKVDFYGASPDEEALCQDIMNCLTNKVSGTRNAPYLSDEFSKKPYRGNYVEVDLTSQMVWLYRSGKVITSGPVVSGNVSAGNRTPTGIYAIQDLDTNCWLVGADYRQNVSYWIGYNGAIGLHDASWRGSFGGQIYQYNGSHGCVNLPTSVAASIYSNSYVGMRVIVYGGVSKPQQLVQEFSGKTEYTLNMDADIFSLDVKAKYPDTTITYESSDPNVVTVDDKGMVTKMGPGTAVITVKSEEMGAMTEAILEIQITIVDPDPDQPENPDEPDDPDTPDTPTDPDDPEDPDTPVDPDEPDVPDVPDEPEQPENPQTPVTPSEPENSEQTETP